MPTVASALKYMQPPRYEPEGGFFSGGPAAGAPTTDGEVVGGEQLAGVDRLGGGAVRGASALRLLHDFLRRVHRVTRRVRTPTSGQGEHEYAREPDVTHN